MPIQLCRSQDFGQEILNDSWPTIAQVGWHRGHAMDSLRTWVIRSAIAVVLLSPVIAFLAIVTVEVLAD